MSALNFPCVFSYVLNNRACLAFSNLLRRILQRISVFRVGSAYLSAIVCHLYMGTTLKLIRSSRTCRSNCRHVKNSATLRT